jgi:hypothetical protein
MSLSAKRRAYSDIPSVSSQPAICCMAQSPHDQAYGVAGENIPPNLTRELPLGSQLLIRQLLVFVDDHLRCLRHSLWSPRHMLRQNGLTKRKTCAWPMRGDEYRPERG